MERIMETTIYIYTGMERIMETTIYIYIYTGMEKIMETTILLSVPGLGSGDIVYK